MLQANETILTVLDLARRQLAAGEPALAASKLRTLIAEAPEQAEAHRLLGRALRDMGETIAAETAELGAIRAATYDQVLAQAAIALVENQLHVAEPILKGRLRENPFDVAAIRMLAELAGRIGRYGDAEQLLRRALELAPAFGAARANLATVLYKQNRFSEAVELLEQVLAREPDHPSHLSLKAASLGRIGGYDEALDLYRQLSERFPQQAPIWMSYGHILKTVGRQEESIAAYRCALTLQPHLGEVWWSLANLKTFRFTAEDRLAMGKALNDGISDEDRFHLHFALGKAFEDERNFESSFTHYAEANRQRRALIDYDARQTRNIVNATISTITPQLLTRHKDGGNRGCDVIFILGMPRAGSTLIEQILASHSMIEGTMELPDMPAIALREGKGKGKVDSGTTWLEMLATADAAQLAALGEEYLERTRIHRTEGKPFYIDKLPNNWLYVGLILLALPGAKIIDARRDPLDCCFSNFKQHFAKGQSFSYDLADMADYYADYVRAMRHFDMIAQGRVHRVIHERVIDNLEGETRALLGYLGVPFEDACLRFYENDRAVRTASSEQVRRPINRDGVGQWRHYEPWLDELINRLGPLVDDWQD